MKRIGYLGVALAWVLTLGVSLFAQEGPQAKSKAEYDAYSAFYSEQDFERKAELGEAFVTEFTDSEFLVPAYQLLVNAYAGSRNWNMVLDAARRFERDAGRDADDRARAFVYQNAMAAAQQSNDVNSIIEYGDRVLDLDRNNLSVLLTLSSVIPQNLPVDPIRREQELARAFDMAHRARIQAQQFFANKPPQFSEADWEAERTKVEQSIHTTLGSVHMTRRDYDRASEEFMRVLEMSPRDGNAYFQLGVAYEFQAAGMSREVVETIDAENAARDNESEVDLIDGLVAEREARQAEVIDKLDQAIDAFARAVAIGGAVGTPAREHLEKLYRNKNEDSLEGLEELIEEKRAELGNI